MFVFCPEAAMSDERGSGEKITGAVWLRGILCLFCFCTFAERLVWRRRILFKTALTKNRCKMSAVFFLSYAKIRNICWPPMLNGRGFLFWLFVSDS